MFKKIWKVNNFKNHSKIELLTYKFVVNALTLRTMLIGNKFRKEKKSPMIFLFISIVGMLHYGGVPYHHNREYKRENKIVLTANTTHNTVLMKFTRRCRFTAITYQVFHIKFASKRLIEANLFQYFT